MRHIFIAFLMFVYMPIYSITPQNLTVEEKIGQMLMPFFFGENANENASQLIEKAHIGNFIYYNWSNGLTSPEQVQALSNGLQVTAQKQPHAIPLLISVDQEGGTVNRLNNGFAIFPSNAIVGQNDYSFAEECAYGIGQQLKAVGINMNLAPVIDVTSEENSPIAPRVFHGSSKEVAKYGAAALQGYHRANVIATLKHFPGYGSANIDAHFGMPTNFKSKEEVEQIDLYPFRQLLAAADAIMTTHILVPALDPDNCTTLSPVIVEGLLRNEMGFNGVIVSDSLTMQGVLDACGSIEEAAIRAIEAGHDLLCFGGKKISENQCDELSVTDILNIHTHIVDAVNSGRISMGRVDASVQRILDLKKKYGLFEM